MDATDRLRWERRARLLLQRLAVAAAEATSVEQALQAAVDQVCAQTGWPVGHALVRDGSELVSAGCWHLEDPERFAAFRRISEATRFPPGLGLPGRVLAGGNPLWIMDVMRDDNFPRAHLAESIQVRAAFAFPVVARAQVFAVLEFFSAEPVEPDVPLLEVMAAIGAQLGRTVERIDADQALRESELRFRSVAQTANDAIISADGDGRIVGWNHGAEQIFGFAGHEVLGQPLTLIIPPRLQARHEAGLARLRAGGPHHVIGRTIELEARRRDGSELPIELSLATWRLGERDYFTGIIRDITERKVAEASLRSIAVRLEASERQAVEASRAKSTFLAHMSHELRTPLNAILGFVQLMERDPTLGPEQRANLAVILRSGEHLLGLINDVLSLSKIEAGQSTVHEAPFDLGRLLHGVHEMFRQRAEAKGLQLLYEAGELPRRVHGDDGKLRQILINLLGNAVKFTERGGLGLRARWRDGRATIEVEDTGPGIAAEHLERLFEPFVQLPATRPDAQGTGLGLAISRKFAALMRGELRVASELGRGARFQVELPLPLGESGEPDEEPSRVIGLSPGQVAPRILVVDNAADNRVLLARLLAAVGLPVRQAADGAEGLQAWAEWRPQLIWMDMRMPIIDGYEATRRIRRAEADDPAAPRTVIVALTASAFDDDRDAILAAGCDEVVAKPFREATIFDALERRLGLRFEREARTPPGGEAEPALTPADLAALPADSTAALAAALAIGDDRAARRAIDAIASGAPATAEALARMVEGFQFDELLGLLERMAP